jgi:hypothetical protein
MPLELEFNTVQTGRCELCAGVRDIGLLITSDTATSEGRSFAWKGYICRGCFGKVWDTRELELWGGVLTLERLASLGYTGRGLSCRLSPDNQL